MRIIYTHILEKQMITDDQNPLNSSELQNADRSYRDQIQGALSTVSMFGSSLSSYINL
jgi:hypothetical protein